MSCIACKYLVMNDIVIMERGGFLGVKTLKIRSSCSDGACTGKYVTTMSQWIILKGLVCVLITKYLPTHTCNYKITFLLQYLGKLFFVVLH